MTRDEIVAAMQGLRFNTYTAGASLTRLQQWLSAAEVSIWNAADWEFKRVPLTNVTVTSGAATEPGDFGKAIRLYDPRGYELLYMEPDEFEENYSAPVPVPTGAAEAYTVIDRQILVGPGESGTFKLSYKRRVSHRADGGTVTAGVMNSANDTPVWDAEHHYILVPWGIRLGVGLENSPEDLNAECAALLAAMAEEHVGGVVDQLRVWSA